MRGKTVILECSCSSEYQDRRYGRRKRVFNVGKDGMGRCTSCGSLRRLPEEA